MKKEPCYIDRFAAVLINNILIQRTRINVRWNDRRVNLKPFRLIWTKSEDNSIADLAKNKYLN